METKKELDNLYEEMSDDEMIEATGDILDGGGVSDWQFHLTIRNETKKDITIESFSHSSGYWYTGYEEKEPKSIPKNSTLEAVGIASYRGSMSGYNLNCKWLCGMDVITLRVSVPWNASNKSSFEVAGMINATGWHNITHDGHNFTRTVTISEAT